MTKDKKRKTFQFDHALSLLARLGIYMSESLVTYCWALSKHTVKEFDVSKPVYKTLSFIEFMEFITRVFYLKVKFGKENVQESQQADYLAMNRLGLKEKGHSPLKRSHLNRIYRNLHRSYTRPLDNICAATSSKVKVLSGLMMRTTHRLMTIVMEHLHLPRDRSQR